MAAAAVPTPVSVEEYLHSVYEPDMDYVDGVLEDRNLGEMDHWRVQRALLLLLVKGEEEYGYYVIQETRTQIGPTRYRVPDTCVLLKNDLPKRIIQKAPMLCVEVLSPEDRLSHMLVKCNDYLSMGVPEVWIIDPGKRAVYVLDQDGTPREMLDGFLHLPGTPMKICIADLFVGFHSE